MAGLVRRRALGQTGAMIVAFSVSATGRPPEQGESTGTVSSSTAQAAADGSVHEAVAAAVKVVRDSGLPNRTSSMFTEIEGEWDEVMAVVKGAVDAVRPFGSRISLVLKADIRHGRTGELDGKVQRLEAALEDL